MTIRRTAETVRMTVFPMRSGTGVPRYCKKNLQRLGQCLKLPATAVFGKRDEGAAQRAHR
jgi:hypothetical protein